MQKSFDNICTNPESIESVPFKIDVNIRKKLSECLFGSNNLILIGMPGSGKTTIGRDLAKCLNKDFLDVDDYMEEKFGRSVGDLLNIKGDNGFMSFEELVTFSIKQSDSVISCSGSVPLYEGAMSYLRKTGKSIYLNMPLRMIHKRLSTMKVDRIIGMGSGMSLDDILEVRRGYYERSSDYVFDYFGDGSKDDIFAKFVYFLLNICVI